MISSPELPEEEQEIILSQDGSWHPVPRCLASPRLTFSRSEDAERIAREEREREVAGLPAGSDDESGGKPGTPRWRTWRTPFFFREHFYLLFPFLCRESVACSTPRPGTPAHAKEIDCIDIDSD